MVKHMHPSICCKAEDFQLSFTHGAIPLWPGKPTVLVQNKNLPEWLDVRLCKCIQDPYIFHGEKGQVKPSSVCASQVKALQCYQRECMRCLFAQTNTIVRFKYSLWMAQKQNANTQNSVLMGGSHPWRPDRSIYTGQSCLHNWKKGWHT